MSLFLPTHIQLAESVGLNYTHGLDLVKCSEVWFKVGKEGRDTIVDLGRDLYHYPPILSFCFTLTNSLNFQVSPNVCVRVAVCG